MKFQARLRVGDWRPLLHFTAFELAFFTTYHYAMHMTPSTGAPFWAPDSVLLCALLLLPPRNWFVYLASTLPLRLIAAAPFEMPVWFLLAAFVNDSLKALVAAALLTQCIPGQGIRFDRLHDFWLYLGLAVVAAPALSGVAGATSWVALGREFWPSLRNWFLGDALANLVLTPLFLCVALNWRRILRATPRRYLEGFAVFLGLYFAVQFARERSLDSVPDLHDYVPVAFLLVAAVRFGPAGASGSLTLMSMSWIASTGGRMSSATPDDPAAVLSTQLFLMVIGVPIMSLSVLMEQQRKTQNSLRESEARFRVMADTAPVMVWISGPDKLATFFNRGWLEFTGRDIQREFGYGWAEGIPADHREDCLAGYCSAFDRRVIWHAEAQLQRADGEYRWVLYRGAPRFGGDGAFDGYIVSCSDITDLKKAQEASLARQKLESLGVLAGGIAHDFNNLLGGIHANAELAETSEEDGDFPVVEIQTIKAIAIRASGIVRQLMIYAGNEGSKVEPVDLSRLVEEMLGLIKLSVSKSAVLKTDLAMDLPTVMGNGPQIQQVVMNLVLNASDALAGKDGVITVATSRGKASGGAISNGTAGTHEGNYIRLEVSDTGAGISKEAQTRIFDPFYSTKITGRGLGLAVVQGVVRAHRGAIELASAPGQGTTFRVFWPIAGDGPDRLAARRVTTSAQIVRSSGTILVVEDEQDLRLCIAKILRKEGLTVIEAGDGSTAVDQLRNHREDIDVVLLDMTIPGTPSRTVAAEAMRLRPNAKLLLTSAYSREAVESLADSAKIRAFIRKPFQLRELVMLIRDALSA